MNCFYYPINLERWNIFNETKGIGDLVEFYTTKESKEKDFAVLYVGDNNNYNKEPGIYAYGCIEKTAIEDKTNKKYCNIRLEYIQYTSPIVTLNSCRTLITPYQNVHIIKPEKINELLELIWNYKNKYFVDENKLNDYINSQEFMPSIFLDKKVYRPIRRSMVNSTGQYIRSSQVSVNALFLAEYMCEVDKNHKTFIRRKNGTNYTETHHLIPISRQNEFENSLDVEENVISLCSNCHNLLHYGKNFEIVLKMLYEKRKDLLKKVGLEISYEKLLSYYI